MPLDFRKELPVVYDVMERNAAGVVACVGVITMNAREASHVNATTKANRLYPKRNVWVVERTPAPANP